MVKKQFGVGAALGLAVGVMSGCLATTSFGYKHYILDAAHYDGYLRGPKPADDLDLRSCEPTSSDKGPCTVMYTKDFLQLKAEDQTLKQQLIDCQRGSTN